jgi:BirA family biotin operon repressor/biotin-[acetyl-CoA-carboxylase] ligase
MSWPVVFFDEIDSTNTEARRRAAHGVDGGVWLQAARQTAGRGRLERSWISERGNLYTTALFHEPGGFAVATRVPFVAALAVCDAIQLTHGSLQPKLKWPNDVRIGGAKVSGILIETGTKDGLLWIATGIGINVSHAPQGTGQRVTSLAEQVEEASLPEVFACLRGAFAKRLAQGRAGMAELRRDWLAQAEGIGETIRVSQPEGALEGVFEDLDPDGALILRLPDGTRQTIRAGDVILSGSNQSHVARH